MKKLVLLIGLLLVPAITGCGNLSPRDNLSPQLDQKIKDIEGKQATLENNQNAFRLEFGRMQNDLSMKNSDGNNVQTGWLNLSSDGWLVAAFGVAVVGMFLFFIYQTQKYKKTSEVLAEQIKSSDDESLKESAMAAAWGTNIEKTVFKLIN